MFGKTVPTPAFRRKHHVESSIFWFRRDLRLADNTGLLQALSGGNPVLPVYILSRWTGEHRWTGAMRQEFLCGCLHSLAANIQAKGGRLIFREGHPVSELLTLARETGAKRIFLNGDPDPHGRSVETRLKAEASSCGIEVHICHDVTVQTAESVLTGSGTPFRVFTPYSTAWRTRPIPPVGPVARFHPNPAAGKVASLPAPELSRWKLVREGEILPAGERAARERLAQFLAGPVLDYGELRNTPYGRTTSRLSQDLRFGLLSPREVVAKASALLEQPGLSAQRRKNIEVFVTEVIWREFYMALLHFYPELLETEFNPGMRGLAWQDDPEGFARWASGTTGFPFVDAGMRELNRTGFMHNRLRMVTAMFLTKDLRVDWRHGERYFMQKLVDGEIASNNGGWQWSAGTGADAAPYFRIQNP